MDFIGLMLFTAAFSSYDGDLSLPLGLWRGLSRLLRIWWNVRGTQPGVCKLPKSPASRALCQAKRAPRAAL